MNLSEANNYQHSRSFVGAADDKPQIKENSIGWANGRRGENLKLKRNNVIILLALIERRGPWWPRRRQPHAQILPGFFKLNPSILSMGPADARKDALPNHPSMAIGKAVTSNRGADASFGRSST